MTEPIDVDALERRFAKWDHAPQRQSAFDLMVDLLAALRQQQAEIAHLRAEPCPYCQATDGVQHHKSCPRDDSWKRKALAGDG